MDPGISLEKFFFSDSPKKLFKDWFKNFFKEFIALLTGNSSDISQAIPPKFLDCLKNIHDFFQKSLSESFGIFS